MSHSNPSLFDKAILAPAVRESFRKLNPRLMIKNPVMFVTQIGAALTTIAIFTSSADRGFVLQLAIWLWFTVLFANAALQAARVAKARSLPADKVRELIAAHTDKAALGLLGVDGVNVLKLNLSLDACP